MSPPALLPKGSKEEEAEEVRNAMDWAQVRTLAAGVHSQREIARRQGINRRTVKRLVEAEEPPRYRREAVGSMLDPLEPVIRRSLAEYPEIKATATRARSTS